MHPQEKRRAQPSDLLPRSAAKFGSVGYSVIRSLQRNIDLLLTHHRVPGLPPDNNITEDVIKQLSKKLDSWKAFRPLSQHKASSATRRLLPIQALHRLRD